MTIFENSRKKVIGLILAAAILVGYMPAMPAFAQPELMPVLRLGSVGSEVVLLQEALREEGYYMLPVNEIYDEATRDAVLAFQLDHGMEPDGVAGQPLYDLLFGVAETPAPTATPTPTPVPTATPTPAPTPTPSIIDPTIVPDFNAYLRKGSSNEQVLLMQQCLYELDYFTETPTSYFGDTTRSAVIEFQRDNGLTADGIAGPATLRKLYTLAGIQDPSQTSAPTPTPTPTPAPTATPTPTPTPAPTASFSPSMIDTSIVPKYNIYLREGSTGDQVKLLQQCLTVLKYYTGSISSTYDAATKRAVTEFQRANGLEHDGIAGPATLKELYDQAGVKAPTATATPRPTTAPIQPDDDDDSIYNYVLKKGMTTSQVGQLQAALEELGYYGTGSLLDAAYYYGDVTVASVKAFQRDHGLTVDGIAGPQTLKEIFSRATEVELTPPTSIPEDELPTEGINYYRYDNGSNLPIEMIDWWEGGSGIIPRGAYFTVVDVRTGYTYRAKRMGGSRHIDFETATKEDTAVMLATYNGKWSWDRRPVWVIYNGRRIAASTNGMPHGQQTLLNNGMEGQVCIHFLGSSTHGSMNVDALHQACVREAFNAGK